MPFMKYKAMEGEGTPYGGIEGSRESSLQLPWKTVWRFRSDRTYEPEIPSYLGFEINSLFAKTKGTCAGIGIWPTQLMGLNRLWAERSCPRK